MAQCQHWGVDMAGTRPPVHQFQLRWSPEPHQTDVFVPRFRCHHPAARWAAGVGRQHTRDAEPTHRQYPSMAASHWRETPRHGAEAAAAIERVEGLLPLDGFQPQPVIVSLKLAWGRIPTRGNLYYVSLPLSIYCINVTPQAPQSLRYHSTPFQQVGVWKTQQLNPTNRVKGGSNHKNDI